MTRRLGVIGLGQMGLAICARLAAGGHEIVACDLDPRRAESARRAGAEICASAAGVFNAATVVLVCLPTERSAFECLDALYTSLSSEVSARPNVAFVVDMSTNTPEFSIRWAERLAGCGVIYLDAPMTNALGRAEDGKLTVFVGGDGFDAGEIEQILLHFAEHVWFVGRSGAGSAVKLGLQVYKFVAEVGYAEAAAVASLGGVDQGTFAELAAATTTDAVRNRLATTRSAPNAADRIVGAPVRLVEKDLGNAADVLRRGGHRNDVTAAAAGYFAEAATTLGPDSDLAMVIDIVLPP